MEINRDEVKKYYNNYVSEYIKKRSMVLSEEYIIWLSEFIKKVKTFDDEANGVHYSDVYTDDEKEKIYLISYLFADIENYYDKNNIEVDVQEATFHNQGVTVNLTSEVSVEMRLWIGQGAVTDVSLIEAGTGEVDIKDVVAFYVK